MTETCGRISWTPFAQYDQEQQCWRTSEDTSLWALTLSYLTLPEVGMLQDGVLYEPVMQVPLTCVPGYSQLPTPTVQQGRNATSGRHPDSQHHTGETLQDLVYSQKLLPTQVVNDMGATKDPKDWEEWAQRQKSSTGEPSPHGRSLWQEALKVGENTPKPSNDGSKYSVDQHRLQLF
jgi:hypothetical protein